MKTCNALSQSVLMNLPGAAVWKDANLNFIACNMNLIRMAGFTSFDDIIGITDYDTKCGAVVSADAFREQDKKVMHEKREIMALDIHPYADGKLYAMITKRAPLYNAAQNAVIGTVAYSTFIDTELYKEFFLQSLQLDCKFKSKDARLSSSINLNTAFDFHELTERESCVLYYYIRDKSLQEISCLLKMPYSVIKAELSHIKSKMGLHTKDSVAMYCIESGFFNYMPLSLLPKNFSLSKILPEL